MNLEKIGENLDKARTERGVSRYNLAKKMGLTYSSICRHMSGNLKDIKTLLKYCEVLGIDPSELLKNTMDYHISPKDRNITVFYPYNLAEAVLGEKTPIRVNADSSDVTYEVYKVYVPAFLECINMLNPQEQFVLEERFANGKTLEEIGEEIGVTRERIRQIESKSLRKLNSPVFRKKYLLDTLNKAFEVALERDRLKDENRRLQAAIGMDEAQSFMMPKAQLPIEVLELSVRPMNCLKKSGVDTLGDLSRMTIEELQNIRHMGSRSLREIITKSRKYGIEFHY